MGREEVIDLTISSIGVRNGATIFEIPRGSETINGLRWLLMSRAQIFRRRKGDSTHHLGKIGLAVERSVAASVCPANTPAHPNAVQAPRSTSWFRTRRREGHRLLGDERRKTTNTNPRIRSPLFDNLVLLVRYESPLYESPIGRLPRRKRTSCGTCCQGAT